MSDMFVGHKSTSFGEFTEVIIEYLCSAVQQLTLSMTYYKLYPHLHNRGYRHFFLGIDQMMQNIALEN